MPRNEDLEHATSHFGHYVDFRRYDGRYDEDLSEFKPPPPEFLEIDHELKESMSLMSFQELTRTLDASYGGGQNVQLNIKHPAEHDQNVEQNFQKALEQQTGPSASRFQPQETTETTKFSPNSPVRPTTFSCAIRSAPATRGNPSIFERTSLRIPVRPAPTPARSFSPVSSTNSAFFPYSSNEEGESPAAARKERMDRKEQDSTGSPKRKGPSTKKHYLSNFDTPAPPAKKPKRG